MAVLPVLQPHDELETKGIDTCTTCPKLCRWSCPVSETEARETSSPWNQVIMSGYLKRGLVTPGAVGDVPYHCTHCGACKEACNHSVDVPLLLSFARARVLSGQSGPPQVMELLGHFGTAGNPYGLDLRERLEEIVTEVRGPDHGLSASGALVYAPGCATIHESPDAVVAFLRALALRGLTGVAVNRVSSACCGLPLLWAGDIAGFQAHAQRHAQRLEGADTVLMHDPACAHALRSRYPELGVRVPAEVLHVSEYLSARLSKPPAASSAPGAVRSVYAPTCHLTRGLGVDETPRVVLGGCATDNVECLPGAAGHPLDCCGASGLLPLTAPHTANAMAESRLAAFRETGADELITSSPRCSAHLRRQDPTVTIVDATALVSRSREPR